jgi:hypothetical protein
MTKSKAAKQRRRMAIHDAPGPAAIARAVREKEARRVEKQVAAAAAKRKEKSQVFRNLMSPLGKVLGGALGTGAAAFAGVPMASGISGTVGSALGSQAMGALGGLVDKIFGHGDYHLSAEDVPQVNSFIPGRHPLDVEASGASIAQGLAGANLRSDVAFDGVSHTRLTRREYVGEIRSTTSFGITAYDLDIGSGSVSPWGGSIAAHYTKYRWEGLVAEFVSLSNPITGALNSGQVGIGTQYDPDAATPGTMRELLSKQHSVSGRPTDSLVHMIECAAETQGINPLWVDQHPDVTQEDGRTTSLGRMFIATDGMPVDDVVVGQLWVTYDVILFAPRLPATLANHAASMAFWQIDSARTPTNLQPLGGPSSLPIPDPMFSTDPLITVGYGGVGNNDPGSNWIYLPLSETPSADRYFVVAYTVGCHTQGGVTNGMSQPNVVLIPDVPPLPVHGTLFMQDFWKGAPTGAAWGAQAPDSGANTYGILWTASQAVLGLVRAPYSQGKQLGRLALAGGGGSAGTVPVLQSSLFVIELPSHVFSTMTARSPSGILSQLDKTGVLARLMKRVELLEGSTCITVPSFGAGPSASAASA